MISRSLVLLGMGVALAFGVPSISVAQTATTKTATVQQVKPKPKAKTTANKPNKKSNKTVAKAKAKKTAAKEDRRAEQKPAACSRRCSSRTTRTRPTARADAKPNSKTAKAKETPKSWRPRRDPPADAARPPIQPVQPGRSIPSNWRSGNDGELRSEQTMPRSGFFGALFGDDAGDAAAKPARSMPPLHRRKGARNSGSTRSSNRRSSTSPATAAAPSSSIPPVRYPLSRRISLGTARRYAIAVGKEGLEFKGPAKVGDKQEWPRWIPTKEMQEREPKKYGQYKDGMPGGGENPLGARAIYLYQGKKDTHLRIHGTNQPADDRHQFVERLLPHGQRTRHRSLPPREGGHPGRRHVTAPSADPRRPAPPAFFCCRRIRTGDPASKTNDRCHFFLAESIPPR